MMLILQKISRRPGGGGLKIRTHADKKEGVKNRHNFADVLYGWPLVGNLPLDRVNAVEVDNCLKMIVYYILPRKRMTFNYGFWVHCTK